MAFDWINSINSRIDENNYDRAELGMQGFMKWLRPQYLDGLNRDNPLYTSGNKYDLPDDMMTYLDEYFTSDSKYKITEDDFVSALGGVGIGKKESASDIANFLGTLEAFKTFDNALNDMIDIARRQGVLKYKPEILTDPSSLMFAALLIDRIDGGYYPTPTHYGAAGYSGDKYATASDIITKSVLAFNKVKYGVDQGWYTWEEAFEYGRSAVPGSLIDIYKANGLSTDGLYEWTILINNILRSDPQEVKEGIIPDISGSSTYGFIGGKEGGIISLLPRHISNLEGDYPFNDSVEPTITKVREGEWIVKKSSEGVEVSKRVYSPERMKDLYTEFLKEKGFFDDADIENYKTVYSPGIQARQKAKVLRDYKRYLNNEGFKPSAETRSRRSRREASPIRTTYETNSFPILDKYYVNLDEVKESIKNLKGELESLSAKLEQHKSNLDELVDQIQNKQSDIEGLEASIPVNDMPDKISEAQARMEKSRADKDNSLARIDEVKKAIKAFEDVIDSNDREIAALESKRDAMGIDEAKKTVVDLSDKLADLKEQLTANAQNKMLAKGQVEDARKAIEQLNSRIDELNNHIDAIAELEKEKAKYEATADSFSGIFLSLNQKLDDAKSEKEMAENKLTKLKDDLAKLQALANASDADVAAARNNVIKRTVELETIRKKEQEQAQKKHEESKAKETVVPTDESKNSKSASVDVASDKSQPDVSSSTIAAQSASTTVKGANKKQDAKVPTTGDFSGIQALASSIAGLSLLTASRKRRKTE